MNRFLILIIIGIIFWGNGILLTQQIDPQIDSQIVILGRFYEHANFQGLSIAIFDTWNGQEVTNKTVKGTFFPPTSPYWPQLFLSSHNFASQTIDNDQCVVDVHYVKVYSRHDWSGYEKECGQVDENYSNAHWLVGYDIFGPKWESINDKVNSWEIQYSIKKKATITCSPHVIVGNISANTKVTRVMRITNTSPHNIHITVSQCIPGFLGKTSFSTKNLDLEPKKSKIVIVSFIMPNNPVGTDYIILSTNAQQREFYWYPIQVCLEVPIKGSDWLKKGEGDYYDMDCSTSDWPTENIDGRDIYLWTIQGLFSQWTEQPFVCIRPKDNWPSQVTLKLSKKGRPIHGSKIINIINK